MGRIGLYGCIGLSIALVIAGLYIRVLHGDLAAVKLERDTNEALYLQCQKDTQTAYEVSNDYQTKLRSVDRRLADAKRLLDGSTCIPINPAGGRNATGTGQLSGQDGLETYWLLEFAADADRVREQLIACQSWIERTR